MNIRSLFISFLILLTASFSVHASSFILVGESDIFTKEQIDRDSKNNIPVFREEVCIEGDFALAAVTLSHWADRQFIENEVIVEDEVININTFYRKCEEYQQIGYDAGMPDFICVRYSDRIATGSYKIEVCE